MTPGLSGADLKNLVNEAALLAARREQNEVRHKDFLDALEKIVLGPERPLLLSRADKERIAYHEGGHAILGLVVPGADPVLQHCVDALHEAIKAETAFRCLVVSGAVHEQEDAKSMIKDGLQRNVVLLRTLVSWVHGGDHVPAKQLTVKTSGRRGR